MSAIQEQIFYGRPASTGIAIGKLVLLRRRTVRPSRSRASPPQEVKKLRRAISSAKQDIRDLMANNGTLAGEILEFQVEMLDDEDLIEPIIDLVQAGQRADAAWQARIKAEIAEYRQSTNDYMRARCADLEDMLQRVLLKLDPQRNHRTAMARDAIILAEDVLPSEFISLNFKHLRGIATLQGNPNNHLSILARERELPLVVGLQEIHTQYAAHQNAVLDAEHGALICHPTPKRLAKIKERLVKGRARARGQASFLAKPAMTADKERIQLLINVNNPEVLTDFVVGHCDGIGLVRTEFLFENGGADEETQYRIYARILRWAEGRPVTVRLLDLGGDKPVGNIRPLEEANPFLGLRGIRFLLAHESLLVTQLRALCRAAVLGQLKVMVPMVTRPDELTLVAQLAQKVIKQLQAEQVPCALPAIGMMIEVPVAALAPHRFDAAFYSIGSNDLVQYMTAAARDSTGPEVCALADINNPTIMEVLAGVVRLAKPKEVSICGDSASDPELVPQLLQQGLRILSITPAALGPIKKTIAKTRLKAR